MLASRGYKVVIWVDQCELKGIIFGKLTSPSLQAQAESIVSFLSDEPKVQQLRQDKAYNLQLLQEQYQIGPSQIDALYNFAKFQFECGNYSGAAEFLYHYRWDHPPSAQLSTDPPVVQCPE